MTVEGNTMTSKKKRSRAIFSKHAISEGTISGSDQEEYQEEEEPDERVEFSSQVAPSQGTSSQEEGEHPAPSRDSVYMYTLSGNNLHKSKMISS